jgi:hypothetical protein
MRANSRFGACSEPLELKDLSVELWILSDYLDLADQGRVESGQVLGGDPILQVISAASLLYRVSIQKPL